MALYSWEATNNAGVGKQGVIEAANKAAVEARLRRMGLSPKSIKAQRQARSFALPGLGRIPSKSRVIFTRQLATMIDAGLPLVQCLEILGTQEPHNGFRQVILGVKSSVESGSTFADGLAKYPRVFDGLYVNLVAAGEVGGILDTILNRLAAYMEKAMKLRQKVKSAMKYPIVVLMISLIITFFLLVKVVPSFAGMFESMGKDLPALTATVVQLSEATQANIHWVLIGVVVFAVLFNYALRTDRGRNAWDSFLLYLPVFGTLIKKAAVARFTRTLGTLISSGVPILDSLEIVAKTSGNKVIERGIMYTREKISEGKSIADPLGETKVFPQMVVQMVAVGESTGAMDIMLGKIADFYDDEVDTAVDGITSMLEPLILVLIGGIIGVVLLAMYLPIFSLADTVSG